MGSSIKLKSIVPAALIAAGFISSGANAADLLVDPPVVEHEVITKPAGGWYLRGDLAYTTSDFDMPHFQANNSNGYKMFSSSDLDDGYGLRLGAGYQINEYLRLEGTYEYTADRDFNGGADEGQDLTNPLAIIPCFEGINPRSNTSCSSTDSAEVSTHTIMANAYVDLGNFNGFTPYLGGGIGGAYVSWGNLTNNTICTDVGAGSAGPGLGCTEAGAQPFDVTVEHEGIDGWRFAWALHAGTSYDLSHNLKLDFGYSYNRIEGGGMFKYTDDALVASKLKNGPQGYDKGIDNHTFRAGIRYQIW